MQISRLMGWMLPVGMTACAGGALYAQSYPIKPIRMLTAEAGGGSDFVARLVAQALTTSLGRQVIVDNRGFNAIEIVARALPDGYTLLSYGSPFWLAPFMQKVSYDPVRDFVPISLTVSSPNVVVVHPAVAAKSIQELIALAKAKPGVLNYASSTNGSLPHLSGELFKSMAGVDIVRVPFKGNGPAFNALMGGQVEVMFTSAGSVLSFVRAGRLRALAVTSAEPTALAPGLPTVTASGLPGYVALSPFGIFAPARTPAAIIAQLNQATVRALNGVDLKEKFFSSGAETIGSSPEQLAAAVKSEMAKWGKIIKDAGIHD